MDDKMKVTKIDAVDIEVFQADVTGCARCGGTHTGVVFTEFLQPPKDGDGIAWRWWGTCPESGDPILMTQVPDAPPQES